MLKTWRWGWGESNLLPQHNYSLSLSHTLKCLQWEKDSSCSSMEDQEDPPQVSPWVDSGYWLYVPALMMLFDAIHSFLCKPYWGDTVLPKAQTPQLRFPSWFLLRMCKLHLKTLPLFTLDAVNAQCDDILKLSATPVRYLLLLLSLVLAIKHSHVDSWATEDMVASPWSTFTSLPDSNSCIHS